jgi:MFS family permease
MKTQQLGIRNNLPQFLLLLLVNAFVGGMVGLERAILPALAGEEFQQATQAAVLSFIVVFGLSKAATNYLAGRWADRYGRKTLLVAGWIVALPVPFLLMWAPTWRWVLAANVALGISQGLTWSTTVIMKIDLAGPKQRGLAMGLNESAGYLAVGLSALATGAIAARYGLRPAPFVLGVVFAVLGTVLSVWWVRETRGYAVLEAANQTPAADISQTRIFLKTTLTDSTLAPVSQAGFVNNLNDGMAWGLFPILFTSAGMGLEQIGWLAAIYPAVWGIGQLFTGAASDRLGRKPFIVLGMVTQAAGIALVAMSSDFWGFAAASALLGAGTAMVYPTLLAALGDVAHPSWRASAVGVYRLWRDSGYAAGALAAGIIADAYGLEAAVWATAALTLASGLLVQLRMPSARAHDRLVSATGPAEVR